MKLQIIVGLEGINSKKDNTFSLRFGTQELTETQKLDVIRAQNGFGILVFKYDKESLTDKEMKEIDNIDVDIYEKNKSQSERLRNVLYRFFEQTELQGHESKETIRHLFSDFYRTKTEQIISHFKSKLQP